MKIFINTGFESFYGWQSTEIVILEDATKATKTLNKKIDRVQDAGNLETF